MTKFVQILVSRSKIVKILAFKIKFLILRTKFVKILDFLSKFRFFFKIKFWIHEQHFSKFWLLGQNFGFGTSKILTKFGFTIEICGNFGYVNQNFIFFTLKSQFLSTFWFFKIKI